jgi:hypothetical protein
VTHLAGASAPVFFIGIGMPWTEKQNRLFQAAAHDPAVAKRVGIPQDKAKQMASEGVKDKPKKMAALLRKK